MLVMKVFDSKDFPKTYHNNDYPTQGGVVRALKDLGAIESNHIYLEWNTSRMLHRAYSEKEGWYEDYDTARKATDWIATNLKHQCPDIMCNEDVLIKVWW